MDEYDEVHGIYASMDPTAQTENVGKDEDFLGYQGPGDRLDYLWREKYEEWKLKTKG